MKARWHNAALKDVVGAIEFARLESEQSAVQIARAIEHGLDQLLAYPESGRTGRREGTRKLLVARGTYLMIYRPMPDHLVILRVWHTSRRRRDQH